MPLFSSFKRSKAPVAPQNIDKTKQQALSAKHSGTDSYNKPPARLQRKLEFPRTYRNIDSDKKEIRLLRLFPAKNEDDPLQCTTQVICLQSRKIPAYETISYCWGKDPGEGWMQIDGIGELVPGSAERVLRRMRSQTQERLLWIDAISINQCNTAEKGDQVAFMCDIYQRGDHNLIWLTPPDKYKYTPTEARSILNSLQAVKANIKRATGGKFRSLMNNPAGTETQNGRLLDASIDLKSLQLLFQSEWFRRLWVAQEAALSQQSTCHFGPCKFPLSDILDAAAWLLYNGLMLPPPMRKQRGLWAARSMWYILDRRNNPDTDLFMAYVLTQNFEATEARDHVYALMGLFKDQQPHLRLRGLLLRPKYTKPLPEVFRDATRACVEDSRNLQALQFVEPSKVPAGYPSWTLLFDAGLSGRDADPICKLGNGFRADGNATCYVMFDEPDTLKARGADIDGIEEYSPTFSSAKSWTNGDHAKLMGQVGSMIRKRRPGKDWINELGLVLVAGHNTSRDRTVVDDFAAFLRYSKQYPTQRLAVPEGQQHDEKNRAGRWYSRFEQTMYGRKFFMTRGGLAGIGPPNMKSGDRIVVLCGGSVPFVMRSTGRKREYVLIGVCYVFGLMQGEFKDYFVAEWMSVR